MTVGHVTGDRSSLDRVVRRVLGQYGYPDSAVQRVEPLPRRIKNDNVRVLAAGRDLVVKRYTTAQVTPRLRLSHAFQVRLWEAGLPLAELQRTPSGETLVDQDGAHFTVHSWVDGSQFTIAERERVLADHPSVLTHLAGMLGQLHRVSAALDHEHEAPVTVDELASHAWATARMLHRSRPPRLSHWRTLRLKPRKTEFDRWIVQALPEVVGHAEQLAAHSGAWATVGTAPILLHHDVNWENLVFDHEGRVRALLDFDNVTLGPRELEVGAAAVVLVGSRPERLEEFLAAYEAAAGTRVDRRLVHVAMRLKCTRSILWSVRTYLSGTVPDTDLMASWCVHLHRSLQELVTPDA